MAARGYHDSSRRLRAWGAADDMLQRAATRQGGHSRIPRLLSPRHVKREGIRPTTASAGGSRKVRATKPPRGRGVSIHATAIVELLVRLQLRTLAQCRGADLARSDGSNDPQGGLREERKAA